jgi:hypothetical protein
MAVRGHNIATAPIEPTVRFLIAMCGPCMLAFPSDWIRGILTREEAGSAQVVTSAGTTYPLTSLTDRLRLSLRADSSDTRLILYGNGTYARAFTVDEVIELVDVERRDLRPLPAHFKGAERTQLSGFLFYGSTVALIVNPLWLLETNGRMDIFRSRVTLQLDEARGPLQDPALVIPDTESSVEHVK